VSVSLCLKSLAKNLNTRAKINCDQPRADVNGHNRVDLTTSRLIISLPSRSQLLLENGTNIAIFATTLFITMREGINYLYIHKLWRVVGVQERETDESN